MITWLILSLNLIILFCFYLKYNKSSSIYKDSWRRKFTPFVKILDFICIMLYWKIFWHGFVAVKLFNFSHKAFYFEHIFVGKTSCNFDIIDVRINKIQLNIKKKFLCWQFDAICWLKKATKHWIISEIRYTDIRKIGNCSSDTLLNLHFICSVVISHLLCTDDLTLRTVFGETPPK